MRLIFKGIDVATTNTVNVSADCNIAGTASEAATCSKFTGKCSLIYILARLFIFIFYFRFTAELSKCWICNYADSKS